MFKTGTSSKFTPFTVITHLTLHILTINFFLSTFTSFYSFCIHSQIY